MHAASRHGTTSLSSFPKDEVSCEVRPPRSPIRNLTSLDRASARFAKDSILTTNVNRTIHSYISKVMEVLKQLSDPTFPLKMYKDIAQSIFICRIAHRSIINKLAT